MQEIIHFKYIIVIYLIFLKLLYSLMHEMELTQIDLNVIGLIQ